MYSYYNQQDSHECLVTVLEMLEKECRGAPTRVQNPFEFYLTFNSVCLKC